MLRKLTLAIVTFLFVIGATVGAALSNELPMPALVDGHPVQSTESHVRWSPKTGQAAKRESSV